MSAFLGLEICALPSIRHHWELHHPGKWRSVHFFLSVIVMVALGLALQTMSYLSKICFAFAVSLLGMELGISLTRRATQAAELKFEKIPAAESEFEEIALIRIPHRSIRDSVAVFYWILGTPFPAVWSKNNENTIILPGEWTQTRKINYDRPIIVEGPYGPSIGICSWLKYWLYKISSPLNMQEVFSYRPSRLPKGRVICFLVDVTTINRTFSLWQYLRLSTLENDRKAKICVFDELINNDLVLQLLRGFMSSNMKSLGIQGSNHDMQNESECIGTLQTFLQNIKQETPDTDIILGERVAFTHKYVSLIQKNSCRSKAL